jgi:hypothetical protein
MELPLSEERATLSALTPEKSVATVAEVPDVRRSKRLSLLVSGLPNKKVNSSELVSPEKNALHPALAKTDKAVELLQPQESPKFYYEMADPNREFREIKRDMADDFLQALDSNEPQTGEALLSFITSFHNQVPSPNHLLVLVNILLHGPKTSQGNIFPDCHRLNLALKYFRQLVVQQGLADRIAASLKPDFWELVLQQMTAEYYTLPGDEIRTDTLALQRIGVTLHARACCLETFEVLLQQQLYNSGSNGAIVQNILNHSLGPKGALEIATKCYLYNWMHHGYLTFGTLSWTESGSDRQTRMEVYDLARSQCVRLLRSLGKIVSLLACFYCKETREDMDTVCSLIGNIALLALKNSKLDLSALVNEDGEYIVMKIKLGLILKLDEQLVPHLYPKLADMLGVAPQFNVIYGGC